MWQGNSKIDTLIITGNGFDIWQGFNTGYAQFKKYYFANRERILKKLHVKKRRLKADGKKLLITDAELIYGNPFDPAELDDSFWNVFESSLEYIDAECINYYFGKRKRDLYKMQKCINNAQEILREAFVGWVSTLEIEDGDSGYRFGENCFCINFNYTETLAKRFGAVYESHIHGSADDGESIIFGHSDHPQRPTYEFVQLMGRFFGLYLIEEALYQTDKDVNGNIQFLRIDMADAGVMPDKIKNVYVLGHSFGRADIGYFRYLRGLTSVTGVENAREPLPPPDESLEDMNLRMNYAIHKYGEHSPVSPEEEEAVMRRLRYEAAMDEEEILADFYPFLEGLKYVGERAEDAAWHISYFSDEDKKRIERAMKEIGCKNYTLYPSIDECIKSFKA